LDALSHELQEFEHTDQLRGEGKMSEVDHALAASLEKGDEMFEHKDGDH
jgi:hypothetical protein